MRIIIPEQLSAACQDSAERRRWLQQLRDLLLTVQQRWSLEIGPPFEGPEVSCAWVATVTRRDGSDAVLKLAMPHMEGESEIEGLRYWAGNPTVELLEADDKHGVMLLERCKPGTWLRELPETEQDAVIASLLRRLWRTPPAPHNFRPLAAMTAFWTDEALAQSEHWPDRGLISEGLTLMNELSQPAAGDVLLATDLHAGNVLRAEREPWLVIDPKPFVGDRAYDATQHLLNCYDRLRLQPHDTIRRFADLLEVDHERVRLWMFARTAARVGDNPRVGQWLAVARALRT